MSAVLSLQLLVTTLLGKLANFVKLSMSLTLNFLCSKYNEEGLPEGQSINIRLTGSAGQSFCAFLSKGVNVTLEGDANDYVGECYLLKLRNI